MIYAINDTNSSSSVQIDLILVMNQAMDPNTEKVCREKV